MDLALRPMSTSQVLDRTFHIYRNHFVLLAGIGALLPGMLLVMQLSFIPLGFPPAANVKQSSESLAILFLGYFCCYGVTYLLGSALAGGATVFGVSKLHLGQSVTIGQSYRQVFSRFWRVLGVITLLGLIVFGSLAAGEVVAIIIVAIFAGSTKMFGGSGGVMWGAGTVLAIMGALLIFLAGAFVALLLYSKLSLAVPACVLEHLPVGASLKRSWNLTKNSMWRIMLVHLLTWILGVVLALAFNIPAQIFVAVMHGKAAFSGIVLQEIGGFFAGVIANPIATTAIALIYYDQRVRKEAFDLQLMMEAVGQQTQLQAQTTAAAPPALG